MAVCFATRTAAARCTPQPSCDIMRDMPRLYTISGKRGFPVSELKLFASARSAGKDMKTPFGEYTAMHTAMHTVCTHTARTRILHSVRAAAHNTTCTARAQCTRGGVLHPTPASLCVCRALDSHCAGPPREQATSRSRSSRLMRRAPATWSSSPSLATSPRSGPRRSPRATLVRLGCR